MRRKTLVALGIVIVLLALGVYFAVDYYRGKQVETPVDTPPAPVEEAKVPEVTPEPAQPEPVVQPAPVETPRPAPARKPAPKVEPKPKPSPAPVVEAPVQAKPEPKAEPAAPEVTPKPTPAPVQKEEPAPVVEKPAAPEPEPEPVDNFDYNQIITKADVMPKFRGGGMKKFQEYINQNIVYPQVAAEMGVYGTVRVSFVVERDGKVSNVKVTKGVDPLLDREALRVVRESPRWKPGTRNGKPVRVASNVMVVFALN